MRKAPVFIAAALLALVLSACGRQPVTHTFDFSGNVVQVSVDAGEEDLQFSDSAVWLYEEREDQEAPRVLLALGAYDRDYETHLSMARASGTCAETETGVTWTDAFGVQNCLLDLGEGVHFRIQARPAAEGVFDRFALTLTESVPLEPKEEESIYLTLVNRTHRLPEGWEERIELLETENYSGETIRVERNAFAAYQALREDLLAEGVDIELESSYRSVERQIELWAEYEERYGLDYCRQYVAVPGFSEHHTGFAIDTSLIQTEEQAGEEQRAALWARVHEKLPAYGFILRYLEGKDAITGYAYEPWHLRYVGDTEIAGAIMSQGLTLEEYLGQVEPSDAVVDCGSSLLFTEGERRDAVAALRREFDTWSGFELLSVRYLGDESSSAWPLPENETGEGYVQCIAFATEFHSPPENSGAFDPDTDYADYPWYFGRTLGGDWELLASGY